MMTKSRCSIEPVQLHHFQEWLELRNRVYSGVTNEFHREEMSIIHQADDKECFLAATSQRNVVGMVEVSLRNVVDACLTSPVGYIEGVYVDPDFRGNGLARELINSAEAWCRSRGCREMGTDAELHEVASQQFHLHMGFEETYRIVEYRKQLTPTE